MTKLPTVDENQFKALHRTDVCSSCPKRVPCATFESICELVTPCAVCEIRDSCTELCEQMTAYLVRGSQGNIDIPMSILEKRIKVNGDGDAESVITYKYLKDKESSKSVGGPLFTMEDVPWPAISDKAGKIILEHFKFGKTYEEIAKKFNMHHKTVYETIHGGENSIGALVTLREYAKYRQLFQQNSNKLTEEIKDIVRLYYEEYKSLKDIAGLKGVSPQYIGRQLQKGKNLLDSSFKTPAAPTYNKETIMLTQEEEFVAYVASRIYGQFGKNAAESVQTAIQIIKETQKQMRNNTDQENDES